jgi:hypothetical protein
MTTSMPGEGPVEQYLDEMFDRVAGTGAAGRRMLAETESHLLAAAAEASSRGLDADTAEREAVRRFGTVDSIASQVPVAAAGVLTSLRRLAVGTWLVVGTAMAWYGLSGVVTWLLGWPWTRLLIATDRFGAQSNMCDRPWIPANPTAACATVYHGMLDAVPIGGDQFPFLAIAICGGALLIGLLAVRRATVLGGSEWTPARAPLGLAIALSFGLTASVLLFYGTTGAVSAAQNWSLSYLTAGLLAAAISAVATRNIRTALLRPGHRQLRA